MLIGTGAGTAGRHVPVYACSQPGQRLWVPAGWESLPGWTAWPPVRLEWSLGLATGLVPWVPIRAFVRLPVLASVPLQATGWSCDHREQLRSPGCRAGCGGEGGGKRTRFRALGSWQKQNPSLGPRPIPYPMAIPTLPHSDPEGADCSIFRRLGFPTAFSMYPVDISKGGEGVGTTELR